MSDFSSRLKKLRTSKGVTQKELGSFLNVSQNAIFNWETKRTEPPMETIEQIAAYFEVSPTYLMGWDEQKGLDHVIADNIVKYRTQLNVSQNNLAEYVGVSVDTIQQMEAGKLVPSPNELIKISDGLMITINQLLNIPTETTDEANARYIHDTFYRNGYYIYEVTNGRNEEYWVSNEKTFYMIDKPMLDKLMESIDDYSAFSIKKALINSIVKYQKDPDQE